MEKQEKSEMNEVVKLVIGDWSGDGHNLTDAVVIRSNLTGKQVEKAYKAAVKKCGLDLVKDVCAEYEDNNISTEHRKKLINIPEVRDLITSWNDDVLPDDLNEAFDFYIDSDAWAGIWLAFTKHGNPEFQYEIIDDPQVNIGGYGLFYA